MIVVMGTTEVTTFVALAGQLVTVGAQLVIVCVLVSKTMEVKSPALEVATGSAVEFTPNETGPAVDEDPLNVKVTL